MWHIWHFGYIRLPFRCSTRQTNRIFESNAVSFNSVEFNSTTSPPHTIIWWLKTAKSFCRTVCSKPVHYTWNQALSESHIEWLHCSLFQVLWYWNAAPCTDQFVGRNVSLNTVPYIWPATGHPQHWVIWSTKWHYCRCSTAYIPPLHTPPSPKSMYDTHCPVLYDVILTNTTDFRINFGDLFLSQIIKSSILFYLVIRNHLCGTNITATRVVMLKITLWKSN